MRRNRIAALTAIAIAGLLLQPSSSPPPVPEPSPPSVLDERDFDFLENEGTGRCLAAIRIILQRGTDGVELVVVASAVGPSVDPIPGWQGVKGSNRITAEEIAAVVRDRRIRVETDREGSGPGSVALGRRGRIPERRLRADGSIDVGAFAPGEHALELVAIARVGLERQRTRLVVDGVVRFEVATEADRIIEAKVVHPADHAGKP